MLSFLVVVVIGTFTEMIFNKYTEIESPQLAPVLAIIPLTAIYFAIRQYGFFKEGANSLIVQPGTILNFANRTKLYRSLSVIFIVGSLLNLISQYYLIINNIIEVLFFSGVLLLIALIMTLITVIKMNDIFRDILAMMCICLAIIIIMLRFAEFGAMTVWATTFIFIVASVVFNKLFMLIGISITSIVANIFMWIRMPIIIVELNAADYLVRIGLLGMTVWLAYYVNKTYINRLIQNEEQANFQKMISEISAELIPVNQDNLDESILKVLEKCATKFNAQRGIYINVVGSVRAHEWCDEGLRPLKDAIPDIYDDKFKWWRDKLRENKVICIKDINDMPIESHGIKSYLEESGIKALLTVPMIRNEKFIGFLMLTSEAFVESCKSESAELVKVVSNILADAIIKVEAEKEISYMAYYDLLTGLANRRLFLNRLEQAINIAKEDKTLLAILFIDLDSFKAVNDTIGHFGGDELLKMVSERLTNIVRKRDTVSRFSGDEFLVLISGIKDVLDVDNIAEKLLSEFKKPFIIKGQEFFVTASCGVSIYPIDGDDPEQLIKNADLAMYKAKDLGKNQYILCSENLKDDVILKTKISNSMYRARQRNEFKLNFQPLIDAKTGKILGVETLLRWSNEEFGNISPSVFIPIAEQTGLISPLGEWVLRNACYQCKKWQDEGYEPIKVAVNLSLEQFKKRKIVKIVENVLEETNLSPEYLELEVTESIAIGEDDYIIEEIKQLKKLGISISIDDFGTEYSSLSRLKELPIDKLKIDMRFVQGVEGDKKDKAIAKTIIQLAKNLELRVIAEGVETKEQFEFFKEADCDEIQGFYFYKPMLASELEKLL